MIDILKDIKHVIIITLCVIGVIFALFFYNYSLETNWIKLVKNNSKKNVDRFKNKFKVQYSYSIDMKEAIEQEISASYEIALRQYIINNKLEISEDKIVSDVKYYRLLTIAISNSCEDIVVDRYILTNDLYRYERTEDWERFKESAYKKFMIRGGNIIKEFYDDSIVIMPVRHWYRLGGAAIEKIIRDESNCLLNNLKTESVLYYKINK